MWLTASDGAGRIVAAPSSSIMPLPGDVPRVAVAFDAPGGVPGTVGRFAVDGGAFVAHVVCEGQVADVTETAEAPGDPHAPDAPLGMLTAPMPGVDVPRLADVDVALGCRVTDTQMLPGTIMLVADVVSWVHPDRLMGRNGLLDVHKMRPVGALAGHQYCPIREVFSSAPVHLLPETIPRHGL